MHIRCPHCHNPVEVVGDDFSDVTCSSCGSRFSLISGETTATHQHNGGRTIGLVACGYSTDIWGADDCVANGWYFDMTEKTLHVSGMPRREFRNRGRARRSIEVNECST